jgi:predicted Zn-dependent protease
VQGRLFFTIPVVLLLFACSTEVIAPFGKEATLQLHEDEKRLWMRSQEEERKLEGSGQIYEEPALLAYLHEVAQKLIPEDVKGKELPFRIRIIKNPHVNAFALPHGVIYLHTGFLAKMESEAQLATVLAHEMTHITHRHAVQGFRTIKSAADVLATLQVVAAPAGIYGIAPLLLGAVGTMAAVSGYSQEVEAEADRVGLDLLLKAGYDPQEAVTLFEQVQKYVEEEKIKEPFFFGSHPRLQERKDSYAQLLRTSHLRMGEKLYKGKESFMKMTHSLLLDNALMDLSMGQFKRAQEAIEKSLSRNPENAKAHYYLAEIHRQRGEEGDRERAQKEYQLARQYNEWYPEPYKGLGLIHYKQGQKEEAREAFEKYLLLAPNASDKGYIEEYLRDMRRSEKSQ